MGFGSGFGGGAVAKKAKKLKVQGGMSVSGTTQLTGSILPGENLTYNIGSNKKKWTNIYSTNLYTGDFHLKNERGDWTFYEERDCIVVKNNITGDKYKMVLEKI